MTHVELGCVLFLTVKTFKNSTLRFKIMSRLMLVYCIVNKYLMN